MKDIMLDIETMGTGNAPVMIQLAAVYFDRETGETGEEFCRSLDIAACESFGFNTTQSTIDWWKEQNQDVLGSILECAELDIKAVMEDFLQFYKKGGKEVSVWSHATFDFVIVQEYLQRLAKGYMHYKGAKDIRTLTDLSGIDLTQYNWDAGKTHNALDDCKFQVKYCVDAMNILRRLK